MLAQALPTGQLWLCFPREEENCTKIDPRRVQKPARGGSKMACEGPLDGFSVPVGPNLAAKAARKPSLGGSGGALATLLALLELFWGLLGRSWGVSWAPLGFHLGLLGASWANLGPLGCIFVANWMLNGCHYGRQVGFE